MEFDEDTAIDFVGRRSKINLEKTIRELRIQPNEFTDLRIECECRFQRTKIDAKTFRRVLQAHVQKKYPMEEIVTTDYILPLDKFIKIRETRTDGVNQIERSIKTSFYLSNTMRDKGLKTTLSLEILGGTANRIFLSYNRKSSTDKLVVRKKTRRSFRIHERWTLDLTEVESYEQSYRYEIPQSSERIKTDMFIVSYGDVIGKSTTAYEIEMDYTERFQRNIDTTLTIISERLPLFIDQCSLFAKNDLYESVHLVKDEILQDIMKNFNEAVKDPEYRYGLSRNIPQVRNMAEHDLFNYKNYVATPKADGLRKILLFGKNHITILSPGNDINIYQYHDNPMYQSDFEGLVLDGELVPKSRIKNRNIRERFEMCYYVFDVIRPCVNISEGNCFEGGDILSRMAYLKNILPSTITETIALRYKMPMAKDRHLNGWIVFGNYLDRKMYFNLKPYEDAYTNTHSAAASFFSFRDSLDYEDDGLVFTPRNTPYEDLETKKYGIRTLKWKPIQQLSIDFEYKDGILRSTNEKRMLVPFRGTTYYPYEPTTSIDFMEFPAVSGLIYECVYHQQDRKFRVQRIREDKEFPNRLEVALDVWYAIQNPIRENTLMGKGYDCLRRMESYRLWDALQETKNANILDLYGVNPSRDLPSHICYEMDIQGKNYNALWNSWEYLIPFSSMSSSIIPGSKRSWPYLDENLSSPDVVIVEGSFLHMILHPEITDMYYISKEIDLNYIRMLRKYILSASKVIVHRMGTYDPSKVYGKQIYGSTDERILVSSLDTKAVIEILEPSKWGVYDCSSYTYTHTYGRISCTIDYNRERNAYSSLAGSDMIVYLDMIRTEIFTVEEVKKLYNYVDDSIEMPISEDSNRSLQEYILSPPLMSKAEESPMSMAFDINSAIAPNGVSLAKYLVSFDEIQPVKGSLEEMILKPIFYRFSKLEGKLPYNEYSMKRFAEQLTRLRLRTQEMQFILDEFQISIIVLDEQYKNMTKIPTKDKIKAEIYTGKSSENGVIILGMVDRDVYRTYIFSDRDIDSPTNPYRDLSGMIHHTDPSIIFFNLRKSQ